MKPIYYVNLIMFQLLLSTYCYSQIESKLEFDPTNSDIRNISFFYEVGDTLNVKRDTLFWSACVQHLFLKNDTIFDQLFLIDEITDSPYSSSNSVDLKIAQFIVNFDKSLIKGVFAINYSKILKQNDLFKKNTVSMDQLGQVLKEKCNPTQIKIYYFKKDIKNIDDNVIIQPKQVILKLVWKEEPFAREYVLMSPASNLKPNIKVLIL